MAITWPIHARTVGHRPTNQRLALTLCDISEDKNWLSLYLSGFAFKIFGFAICLCASKFVDDSKQTTKESLGVNDALPPKIDRF